MTHDILLHICCAPDATVPWQSLIEEGHRVVGFFYSSNIHPFSEFKRRARDVETLSRVLGSGCIFGPYEPPRWLEAVRDHLMAPEGGGRCALCFRAQLSAAAALAFSQGIGSLSTTLTISPHKDVAVIDRIGGEVCREYGLQWIFRVWRKKGGFQLSVKRSSRLRFYRQRYCGCIMSIRDEGSE
ncbi:MAG: epoxyqueuosine reductase QueH [Thermovirgaceae bacterium]